MLESLPGYKRLKTKPLQRRSHGRRRMCANCEVVIPSEQKMDAFQTRGTMLLLMRVNMHFILNYLDIILIKSINLGEPKQDGEFFPGRD